jgi:phosphoribosylformylglycinamidine synthase
VRGQIEARRVAACHDLSDGGLLVGLAEMCIAGGTGITIRQPAGTAVPSHAFFYGEDQARYLIATGSGDDVLEAAKAAGVPAALLGYSGGASLTIEGLASLPLAEIKKAHEDWLPTYMNAAE